MPFLSEICISESTPSTVTKRVSQFRRLLLRRKQAHLHIATHSLKSRLNCDVEEKGIVLPELSCRTATEAPPTVAPDLVPPPVPPNADFLMSCA